MRIIIYTFHGTEFVVGLTKSRILHCLIDERRPCKIAKKFRRRTDLKLNSEMKMAGT
jgi:hypothetical protein